MFEFKFGYSQQFQNINQQKSINFTSNNNNILTSHKLRVTNNDTINQKRKKKLQKLNLYLQ